MGEHTPFGKRLEHSVIGNGPYKVQIDIIEGKPNKIIRKFGSQFFRNMGEGNTPEDKKGVAERLHLVAQNVNKLKEYHDGFETPVEFVVGEDESKRPMLYAIVDRIEGETLRTTLNLARVWSEERRAQFAKQLEKMICSLIQYVKDQFTKGDFIMGDIFNSGQFMYGTKANETKEKIYLVDIEPILVTTDDAYEMHSYRIYLIDMLRTIEERLQIDLTRARKELKKLGDFTTS